MCVFVCLHVEPVSRSKDYVQSGIKKLICLMPVHTCVAECAWNAGYTCHWGASFFEDVPLDEFMCPVFAHMPGESYCRWLGSSLLYLCYIFWALFPTLFYHSISPFCLIIPSQWWWWWWWRWQWWWSWDVWISLLWVSVSLFCWSSSGLSLVLGSRDSWSGVGEVITVGR